MKAEVFAHAKSTVAFGTPLHNPDVLHRGLFKKVVHECLTDSPDGKCTMHVVGSDIENWDVSNVTNMNLAFAGRRSFDGNLGQWDVRSVTTFKGMFQKAFAFTGKGLEKWNVSKGESFREMFSFAKKFNANIENWQTLSAKNMQYMFESAYRFDHDVISWSVHDGLTKCKWKGSESKTVCAGGQGADTRNMFLTANAFLQKYVCGVHGPPKVCIKQEVGVVVDASDLGPYVNEETVDPTTGTVAVNIYTTQNYTMERKFQYLDDKTIWGMPRLNVKTVEIIENERFILDDDYGYMLGGLILPGVLIAGTIFVLSVAYFLLRFWMCCFWVITGDCECCFKAKPPAPRAKRAAKISVVVCSLVAIVGAALLFFGASNLPHAVDEMMQELRHSLNSLDNDVKSYLSAYNNSGSFLSDGGQSEKTEADNMTQTIKKVVNTFEEKTKERIDDTEKAALAFASFFLLLSVLVSLAVLCNFKTGLIFTAVPLWLFLLIAWIMFGVFMALAQFFDDLNETAIFWRKMENRCPVGANPMNDLENVLPCFSDKVALDLQTGARKAIYNGISGINKGLQSQLKTVILERQLNIVELNTVELINEQYYETTVRELCGEKNGKFTKVDSSYDEYPKDEYEAMACNLHELNILQDPDIVFASRNASGYDVPEIVNGFVISNSHTQTLEDASAYYNVSTIPSLNAIPNLRQVANLTANLTQVPHIKLMEEAMKNLTSVARCTHVSAFIQRITVEDGYIDAQTGISISPPEETIVYRLRHYCAILTAAWFLIAVSYMVTYVFLIKYVYMLQAEDKDKYSKAEMKQVWGRSYFE